jgi:hypothetical protein
MRIRSKQRASSERQGLPAKLAIEGILSKLGFDPAMYAIFEAWDREARHLAPGCEAVAIQGSRICVRVPSAAHRQELHYSKKRIIDRLNQVLGRRFITDIQFEMKGSTSGQSKST